MEATRLETNTKKVAHEQGVVDAVSHELLAVEQAAADTIALLQQRSVEFERW